MQKKKVENESKCMKELSYEVLQIWKLVAKACETKLRTIEEVDCFKYLGLQEVADEGCERDVASDAKQKNMSFFF